MDHQTRPWRPVAELILVRVGNLNFGREFCTLDSSFFNLKCLPLFYVSVFKIWNMMDITVLESNPSLHWLLRETSRLLEIPRQPGSLIRCGVVIVKTFVQLTSGNIADTMALAAKLEIPSIRIAEQLLASFRNTVS